MQISNLKDLEHAVTGRK